MADEEGENDLVARLHRIEGQVRGVVRMLGDGRDCIEVVTQLAAIIAATRKVAHLHLKGYARECLLVAVEDGGEEEVEKLITALDRVL